MKNYIQDGDTITVNAPADVKSGEVVSVGSIFGFAKNSALAGEKVPVKVTGVFEAPVLAASDVAQGDPVYFDGTVLTADSDGGANTEVGCATDAAVSDGTEALTNVRLHA